MIKDHCIRCKYDEFKKSLTIHHIDGNHLNDSEDNKLVLCWNCHMAYHRTEWKLEDIGMKSPVKDGLWYLHNKRGRKSNEHKERLETESIEAMRTELDKVQLMLPNKESKL